MMLTHRHIENIRASCQDIEWIWLYAFSDVIVKTFCNGI